MQRDPAGQQIFAWAEEGGGARPLELGERLVLAGARVLERLGDRGLGPEQKARRSVGAPRARKACQALSRDLAEARPLLVLLADVRLDDPNRLQPFL